METKIRSCRVCERARQRYSEQLGALGMRSSKESMRKLYTLRYKLQPFLVTVYYLEALLVSHQVPFVTFVT
jgi:hypothetical protein